MNKIFSIVAVIACLVASVACDHIGYPVFQDEQTGEWVVKHPRNGRYWLRCDVGQKWDQKNKKCTGERVELVYTKAMNACPEGFMLPNNKDFATILCNYGHDVDDRIKYDSCSECSICDRMFPDGKNIYYSSNTYWSDEVNDYIGFVFELWSGYVWYGGPTQDETANVMCIKIP